jgi:threonyl-tRNA synthetase
VPYMIIVGEKEKESGKISVRTREGRDIHDVEVEEFITKITGEINSRSISLTY